MKICCISDTHGFLPDIPDCDLLLIGGDILPLRIQSDLFCSRQWLNTNFSEWMGGHAKRFIRTAFIAGNHDFLFEKEKCNCPLHWGYLQDSGKEMYGKRIWGTPWQPYFGGWAFNLYEKDLVEKWGLIPKKTDILMVHGPPYKCGDQTNYLENVGSPSLRDRIKVVKPKLVVTGHIHSGYGIYDLDGTVVVNASLMDEDYKLVNKPVVIEI